MAGHIHTHMTQCLHITKWISELASSLHYVINMMKTQQFIHTYILLTAE